MGYKKAIFTLLIYGLLCVSGHTFAIEPEQIQQYFEQYAIQITPSKNINTTFPFQPAIAGQEHGAAPDLSTLVSIKLPDRRDHHAAGYVYFPKLDIIGPIVLPSNSDRKKIFNGQEFNHYPYLQEGILHYYGEKPSAGEGNMVLAAHSSFAHADSGRFNTIFQVVPLLRDSDQIHYYERNHQGTYDRYVYEVSTSKEISPYNVSILEHSRKPILTAYTCYPLGTTRNRWVIHADLISTSKDHTTLTIDVSGSSTQETDADSNVISEQLEEPSDTLDRSLHTEVTELPITNHIDPTPDPLQSQTLKTEHAAAPEASITNTTKVELLTSQLLSVTIPDSATQPYKDIIQKIKTIKLFSTKKNPKIITALKQAVKSRLQSLIQTALDNDAPSHKTVVQKIIKTLVIYQALDS